ncbi:MAG: ferredoxin [Clostridiales bacterium GWF2_36_10]|nr:MAG: ferredoxin [Clostridiales bacterium GWF2_36_10]HAN21544.1 ferredoxin [Clostridiales bacterium]
MNSILLAVLLVSGIGLVCGIGLALANLFMNVEINEKAEEILNILPGANCGACSFSGCKRYAEALSSGKVKTTLCTVGGDKVARQISEILGMKVATADKKMAYVFCQGSNEHTKKKFLYQGITTCKAASGIFRGDGECRFGCIGMGDCVKVCNYNALIIKNGVAYVNPDKCVACGACIKACPKKIISLLPQKKTALVLCANTDKGAVTRKICTAGCIACKLCAKVCEFDAISFNGGLAVIDREKCTGCGKCKEVCKSNCLIITK